MMSEDMFRRISAYRAAMSVARSMLRQGVITQEDYRKIDTIMAQKHGVSLDSIFR